MHQSPWDIVIRPIITEKSVTGGNVGKYTFRVHPDANKIQIKRAVEEIHKEDNIRVVKINTMIVKGKPRRRGGRMRPGRTAAWKKAIVTLAPGQKINLFEKTE